MDAGQEQDSDQSNSGIQQHDAQAISGEQQTPLVPPQPRLGPSAAVSMLISELEIWHYEIFLYWLGADPSLPIADAVALFETKTSELLHALATAANEFCRTTDRLERTAQAGQPVHVVGPCGNLSDATIVSMENFANGTVLLKYAGPLGLTLDVSVLIVITDDRHQVFNDGDTVRYNCNEYKIVAPLPRSRYCIRRTTDSNDTGIVKWHELELVLRISDRPLPYDGLLPNTPQFVTPPGGSSGAAGSAELGSGTSSTSGASERTLSSPSKLTIIKYTTNGDCRIADLCVSRQIDFGDNEQMDAPPDPFCITPQCDTAEVRKMEVDYEPLVYQQSAWLRRMDMHGSEIEHKQLFAETVWPAKLNLTKLNSYSSQQNAPHDWQGLEKLVAQLESAYSLMTFISAAFNGNLKVVLPYQERDRSGQLKSKISDPTIEHLVVKQLAAARATVFNAVSPLSAAFKRYKRESIANNRLHFVYMTDYLTADALLKTAIPALLNDAEKNSLLQYIKGQEQQSVTTKIYLGRQMSAFEVIAHFHENRRTAISNSSTIRDFEAYYNKPVQPKSTDVTHMLQQVKLDDHRYLDVLGRSRFKTSHERLHFVLALMRLTKIKSEDIERMASWLTKQAKQFNDSNTEESCDDWERAFLEKWETVTALHSTLYGFSVPTPN